MTGRNLTVRSLRIFGKCWLTLSGLFILGCLISIWYFQGFTRVQEVMSPFNVVNFIVMAITVAPGIGAMELADWLEKRGA